MLANSKSRRCPAQLTPGLMLACATAVQLLLFMPKAKGPTVGVLSRQPMGSQAPATAPVMSGTPRYLQLR